jgi:hypothetical protein
MAKFDFLYEDYASALLSIEKCVELIDKMSKYDVPTQMQLEYSSMLRWMGLILLIIKKDKEAE